MFVKFFLFLGFMIFNSSANDSSSVECNISDLIQKNKCGENEVCLQVDAQSAIGQCICLPNYVRENSKCIKNITSTDDLSTSLSFDSISNVSIYLMYVVILAIVIGICIFVNNKYRILFNIKEKYFRRKNPDQFVQFENRERF